MESFLSILQLDAHGRSERLQKLYTRIQNDHSYGKLFTVLLAPQAEDADGALGGLAYVVKDSIEIEGVPLGFGLKDPLLEKSKRSAEVVDLMNSLGAQCLAKTTLDEACLDFFGDNPYTGEVLNPLDPQIYPGGSSGAVAVAVASQMVDFGLGSDFGGSVRIPAAACELYGLKLSPTAFPRKGCLLYDDTLDSLGLLVRNERELKFLLSALLPKERCHNLPTEMWIPHSSDFAELGEGVKENFARLCDCLATHFDLRELRSGVFLEAKKIRKLIALSQIESCFDKWGLRVDSLSDGLQAQYQYAQSIGEKLFVPEQKRTDLAIDLSESMILTPCLGAEMPERGRDQQKSEFQRNGGIFLYLANVLGLPALSFPSGLGALQLVGPKMSENTLLDLSSKIEELIHSS